MSVEYIHWIQVVLESGLVLAVGRMLVIVGKMMQRQEDHAERIRTLEERMNFSEHRS